MTNEVGAVAPVDGRFRPESISHFKEVAKNMAWVLERPVQKCQEDLARIYGYSGFHELQQILKRPGVPGPFAPRYNYLASDDEALVEGHDERIFFFLFGERQGYWRDRCTVKDRCYLVFEMGLFQEAAEHRSCFEKIRQVLSFEVSIDRWPLIHGWPLGLRSWLASGYTETVDLADGWQKVLPKSKYASVEVADIRWQRRMTGLVRLKTMFQILAPRVGGRKPSGMGKVSFEQLDDDGGGFSEPSWEAYYLVDWLSNKLSQVTDPTVHLQKEMIESFVQRPSRATAAACEWVKDLKDPVGFRDRWAFESFKAALSRYDTNDKALFSSCLDEGHIQSLLLHMDVSSAQIGEGSGCQLWQFNCTRNKVADLIGCRTILQPVIHASGSLIVPWDHELTAMSPNDWFFCHDDSDFASEAAAFAFEKLYLPSIGVKKLDFSYHPVDYSIIEIDEFLLASSISAEDLKSYFACLLGAFDDTPGCLPDSYGFWSETLSLSYEDEDENNERNQDCEYADYVYAPSVLLINVSGCGLTFVDAIHKSGKRVSSVTHDAKKSTTTTGKALATMVMEATRGLKVDIVVYDRGF